MKTITFSDEAREKLKRGVDLIANSVKVTLGPRGRNMIYGFHYGYPVCTKDGVTVARQVEAKDPTEQLGLLLVRQVAQKTADDAGDGTTTATLLAQEIFTEGLRALKSGANPILIKRGIDQAVIQVVAFIDAKKFPIVQDPLKIEQIATLAANNEPSIGKLVNEAVSKVGKDGVITIEDNYQGQDTLVEIVEGMQFNEGLFSPYFITDPVKMEASYLNPLVIIMEEDLLNISQIKRILEEALKTGRPVVLVAPNVVNQVMVGLVQAKMKSSAPIVVVKAPYFGIYRTDQLIDLSILTGGKVLGHSTGLRPEQAEVADLGQCDMVKATRHYTTFTGGRGLKSDIEGRVETIKLAIEKAESDYEREKLRERLSKLTSGVAVIKVGGPTEVEQKEKKMRVEDALLAAKAAVEDGIVPGGGKTLLAAAEDITEGPDLTEEELIGRRIIKKALRAPIKQIAANAGIEGAEIIARLLNEPFLIGYDFLTNKYGNLMDLGVVDPAKVVKSTIINASSVAALLLTTEVICAEEDEVAPTRTPKPTSM
jgi:chaperonin GroEL